MKPLYIVLIVLSVIGAALAARMFYLRKKRADFQQLEATGNEQLWGTLFAPVTAYGKKGAATVINLKGAKQ